MLYPIPSGGPPALKTFEPAPIEEIGTVDEQLAVWHEWLDQAKRQRQVDASGFAASSDDPKPNRSSFWNRIWKRR